MDFPTTSSSEKALIFCLKFYVFFHSKTCERTFKIKGWGWPSQGKGLIRPAWRAVQSPAASLRLSQSRSESSQRFTWVKTEDRLSRSKDSPGKRRRKRQKPSDLTKKKVFSQEEPFKEKQPHDFFRKKWGQYKEEQLNFIQNCPAQH